MKKDNFLKPKKLKGNVPLFFTQESIAKIGSAVNYNAAVLELALYRIEQLENTVFKPQAESENV